MSQNNTTGNHEPAEGPLQRLEWWILFKGDRIAITAGAVVAVFALGRVLIWLDVIAVGANSHIPSVFSGVIAGLLTLITVTLTINQLILSRVFGTPQELSNNLEGNRQYRNSIEDLADRHSVPTEPADFLSVIGETLHERTTSLQEKIDEAANDRQDASGQLSDIMSEADTLRTIDAEQMRGIEVLEIILGSKHARNISTADRLQDMYADRLSEEAQDDLDAVIELLEAVAIARQHYKTLLLQQTLAQSSRYITYLGSVQLSSRSSFLSFIGPRQVP